MGEPTVHHHPPPVAGATTVEISLERHRRKLVEAPSSESRRCIVTGISLESSSPERSLQEFPSESRRSRNYYLTHSLYYSVIDYVIILIYK